MKHDPIDAEPFVENIIAAYRRASQAQVAEGRAWYPTARGIVEAIASAADTDPHRVAHCLSALSPRNPWLWNVADTYHYVVAARFGADRPSATTFERNRRAAWNALQADGQPWASAAPKVRAFVAAILGDDQAVVVDTWAYRAATHAAPPRNGSFAARLYPVIASAYVEAARMLGESPRNVQAVTWIVVQTEGLASRRKSRHDLTYKAGTPKFVRDLLA